MSTVDPLPAWASGVSECELLLELRATPELLADVALTEGSELHVQKLLRRKYPDALVRMALTLAEARRKGAAKFSQADRMWFDREGLEQATAERVAIHKAERFSGDVLDLCCGIGSDSGAMARRARVTAIDIDPTMCLRTLWNAEVFGVKGQVSTECRDASEVDVSGCLIHVDPDRRPDLGGRALRIEDYVPSLDSLLLMVERARGGAIKLSPASNFGGKFPHTEVELISLHGECKEATIWFGELAGEHPCRATALPSGETIAGHPLDALAERSTLGSWIFDPDPAIVRAGLVDQLAQTLGLRRLDDAEEYLTGDEPVDSPFLQTFEVLQGLSNQDREIRHALRKLNFGSLEIKCRHIPINASELRRRLPRGTGKQPGVLLFVREQGRARAVLARRVPRNAEAQG